MFKCFSFLGFVGVALPSFSRFTTHNSSPRLALQTSHNIDHKQGSRVLINSIVQRPWPQLKKKPINLHLNGGPGLLYFLTTCPRRAFRLTWIPTLRSKDHDHSSRGQRTKQKCRSLQVRIVCGSFVRCPLSIVQGTDFSFMKIILKEGNKNEKVSFVLV